MLAKAPLVLQRFAWALSVFEPALRNILGLRGPPFKQLPKCRFRRGTALRIQIVALHIKAASSKVTPACVGLVGREPALEQQRPQLIIDQSCPLADRTVADA